MIKNTSKQCNKILPNVLMCLFVLLFISCESDICQSVEQSIENNNNNENYKDYTVALDAEKIIDIQKTGELRVWIGYEKFMPDIIQNIVRDTTTYPGDKGKFAIVIPYAPDFEVKPEKSDCFRIDSSGSSVRFTLTPQKRGQFNVSAEVKLFEDCDCATTPIPKTSETLKVQVKVDYKNVLISKIEELISILWNKFVIFWGALITSFFSVSLLLIKKKIRKKKKSEKNK